MIRIFSRAYKPEDVFVVPDSFNHQHVLAFADCLYMRGRGPAKTFVP